MLLIKTPLRLSFFGGGSDIPSHFNEFGGATLSATFNKFVYASLIPTPNNHIKISYSDTEYATDVDKIKHSIVRETLKYFNINSNVEISSFADIPTIGTGLGASSAFCVSLIEAITSFQNIQLPKFKIVEIATEIELDLCKSPIGFQDHLAAAYGGINFVDYSKEDIKISSIVGNYSNLNSCLFLVQMPQREISANKLLSTKMTTKEVCELSNMARYAKKCNILSNTNELGKLLHESWMIKRTLHPHMTTTDINTAYDDGIKAGIVGGKLLGAGNGGFLLMCAKDEDHKHYVQNNIFHYTKCYDIKIVYDGAKVVYDSRI